MNRFPLLSWVPAFWTFVIAIFLTHSPFVSGAAILTVAQDGSGTHKTIQSAIDAADPGAVIEIKPGVYRETVSIQKAVELRGSRWNDVILTTEGAPIRADLLKKIEQTYGKTWMTETNMPDFSPVLREFGMPLISVKGAHGIVISGLKATHPMVVDNNGLLAASLVEFDGSTGFVVNAAVLGGPANGIVAKNGSDLVVSNCLVAAHWNTGIAVGSRNDTANKALITDSEIRNCYHRGITIRSENSVRVERCRISGSAWHGIRYDDSSPIILGSLIHDNARSGIYASGKTAAEVRNNVFWNNAFSAWSQNADRIEQNTFISPQRGGVDLIGHSRPTIRSNIFMSNYNAISQGTSQGEDPHQVGGLNNLVIQGNVFWRNSGIWRPFNEHRASMIKVAGSPLAKSGNSDADPGLNNIPADFRTSPEFRAEYPGIGSSAPFVAQSLWPLQPEELKIIPDGNTRDSKLWKSGP